MRPRRYMWIVCVGCRSRSVFLPRQQRPGEADTLLLPAGEPVPAFTGPRLQALGQLERKVEDPRLLRCDMDLHFHGARSAATDNVVYRVVFHR